MEECISREAALETVREGLGLEYGVVEDLDVEDNEVYLNVKNLRAADVLDVDKAMLFIEDYAFKDEKEVYTNGAVLVPMFRVKQALVDKAYNGLFGGVMDGGHDNAE